ncbi:unnamed protein product [Blepharisma stoltei]|uniref:Uncharacterized protein n=1 Tax=Blepharisma stoltei TaxID=1481888 RepID=A0AAU9K6I8_9CILI|nr:unnamed protein product [Blepharisma stoltei]
MELPMIIDTDPRCRPLSHQKPSSQHLQAWQYPNQNPILCHYSPSPPQSDYKPPCPITNSFPDTKPDARPLRKEELTAKEESLLSIENPDALFRAFMKLRQWDYQYAITKARFGYQATIGVCDEIIFQTHSYNENKARLKGIISVIYKYDSYLLLKWLSKHEEFLAAKINKF